MALNAVGEAERTGKELLTLTAAFPANGILVVPTPFANIDSVSAMINLVTAPVTSNFSWLFTGGVLSIRGWKVTAAGDTTLIASDATETVSVTVIGRRRR